MALFAVSKPLLWTSCSRSALWFQEATILRLISSVCCCPLSLLMYDHRDCRIGKGKGRFLLHLYSRYSQIHLWVGVYELCSWFHQHSWKVLLLFLQELCQGSGMCWWEFRIRNRLDRDILAISSMSPIQYEIVHSVMIRVIWLMPICWTESSSRTIVTSWPP